MAGLILPVPFYTGLSTWQNHIDRGTPSSEPGTDFYIPHGTRVVAPADGEIWGYGESVEPATGRWVGINFANGMSFRCLHHAELLKRGGRVFQGDEIAISGSSGYGSEYFGEPYRNAAFYANTGGDHTHATLWLDWNHRYGYRSPGVPYTVDLMAYVDGALAGGGAVDFTTKTSEEDDMRARKQLGVPDSGLIIEPGVPPHSLTDQVYDALVSAYGLTSVELEDWKYGTVLREQWTSAKLAAALEPGADLPADAIAKIVAGINAGIDDAVSGQLGTDEILARLSALPAEVVDAIKARL